MKRILTPVLLVGLFALTGCVELARGLAEAPYEKAMLQGRMSPSEYRQQQEAIRQASETRK